MKQPNLISRFILTVMLFLAAFFTTNKVSAQQSLINVGGWNAYVHLPWDYDANPTTEYPTIIFFPGLGEVGTTATKVILNGPGAYLAQGWDGNVKIGTDSVKFIIISLQPPSAWPWEVNVNPKIQLLKSLYRIDTKKMHLTGLSMGGWVSTTFVTGDPLGGPYTYASQVATVVEVEGVKPDDNQPYPQLFNNFATTGGRLLGFEQVNDGRDILTRTNQMSYTKSASGIFVSTNYSGGGHCCWEQFYGGKGHLPNVFILDGIKQNIYEWMARNPLITAGALPVTLTDFSAKIDKDEIALFWKTSSELNSNYYEIQRSKDGQNFSKIGNIYAAGTSSVENMYTFKDITPLKGINYYRLSMVDLDGKMSYSKTVSVSVKVAHSFTTDYVKLSSQTKKLSFSLNSERAQNVRAAVTDVMGRVYFTESLQLQAGPNSFDKTIPGLGKGIYYLKLSADDELITKPLLTE
ncbi:MAG: hypothetical protein ABI691_13715 [Ginsengibacter sp.]